MRPTTIQAIHELVQQSEKIRVITHIGPDGDAVGSLTAVGLALAQWGKRVTLMCDDNIPERFQYLALTRTVKRPRAKRHSPPDLVIAVDCGDELRMGDAFASLPQPRPPLINIDHHITNTYFGQVNLVQETAVSTTEILYDLFVALSLEMTRDLAMSLLTGLVTDTLGFRTVGTSAKTLKVASELVGAGADLALVTMQGLNLKQIATLKLWRYGLDNMKMEEGFIWTTITQAQRKAASYNGASSNGLTNMLADVDEAAIGAVIMEMEEGVVRVGFRCRPPYDVATLAQNLGGGGHPLASGCTLSGSLAEVEQLVVDMAKAAIRQQTAKAD